MPSIFFKFPDQKEFQLIIKKLDEVQDTTPVMARIAGMLKGYVRQNFEEEGRPVKWTPLSPLYKAQKEEERGVANILKTTGQLLRSVQPSYGKDYARVSPNQVYAAIHHFGGTVKAKKGKSLSFRLDGASIIRKSVTIPARPFMTITSDDEAEITTEIQNFIVRKLGLR
jgi:phage virion morphogenesis protein